MRNLIIAGVFTLMSISIYAQRDLSHDSNIHTRMIDLNEKMLAFGLTEAEFESIKDEAYANPKFNNGNIYQDDEVVQRNIPLRYNAFSDEIEIKAKPSDETYGALIKSPDVYVNIANDIYIFVTNERSPDKSGYFNVLLEGSRYDLYKKTVTTFQEGREPKSTYDRGTPPSFNKSSTYYLVDNGRFLEIPNSRSNIMKMMSSKKSEMRSYIKKNKLDVREEADLIKTIGYFNSLQ